MKKPSLLYASPFPPVKSGISDYSVMLVKALAKDYDITLYIDDYQISESSLKGFPVLKYGVDHVDFDAFDYRIYNMGNQPYYHSYIYEAALEYPGMVIMHDLSLYYLYIGYYQDRSRLYSQLYQTEGIETFMGIKEIVKSHRGNLLAYKNAADKLMLNVELLTSGNRFMVHSEYARDKILAIGNRAAADVRKINMIAQIDQGEKLIPREWLYRKYKVPLDSLVIASFGYIAETKLNRETIQAIDSLSKRSRKPLCYVMVGDGFYADDLLQKGRIIKTGYTELDEFNSFLSYADIVVNLRYPTLGETSAAMLRILEKGKPCITNNGGWFSEIPNDCVYRIKLDDIQGNIEKAIGELIRNDDKRIAMGKAAKRYVEEECGADTIRKQIYSFLAH